MGIATLLALLLATVPARPADATPWHTLPPAASPEAFAALRDRILPTEEESAWRRIPWRTNLRDGIADGAASGRPLLLWLMNGHPMGDT